MASAPFIIRRGIRLTKATDFEVIEKNEFRAVDETRPDFDGRKKKGTYRAAQYLKCEIYFHDAMKATALDANRRRYY